MTGSSHAVKNQGLHWRSNNRIPDVERQQTFAGVAGVTNNVIEYSTMPQPIKRTPSARVLSQNPLSPQSTSPIPKRPIVLQPVHRQISPLVGVFGRQLLIDVHPVAG